MSVTAHVAGETLELFPERAAFWPRRRTLFVADAHFGKAAAFRAGGIPVPSGTTNAALRRLDTLIDVTGAARVVFLGDFLHAREGRAPETLQVLSEWRARRSHIELLLVRGNHDRRAGDPDSGLIIHCVDAPHVEPPFAFAHYPTPSDSGYVFAGHIHPSVSLYGGARQSERLPCFWFGARAGVLPAFGEFTGFVDVPVTEGDQVWVIAGAEIRQVTGAAA